MKKMLSQKGIVRIASVFMFALFIVCANSMIVNATALGDPSNAVNAGSFAELKAALEGGATEVALTGSSYTATSNIGGTASSTYLDHDVTIYGNEKTLDMRTYQFNLKGSHKLQVENLTINNASSGKSGRNGAFSLANGGTSGSPVSWEAKFADVTYNGSSLIGTNVNDSISASRYFNSVVFSGTNKIVLTNRGAKNAVVFARNVEINGNLDIHDELISSPTTGADGATYRYYFKSPGTGTSVSEGNSNVAYGTFKVAADANVTLNRSPNRGTDGVTSAYHRSLIYGYEQFLFEENSVFNAKAGTNRSANDALDTRSAIIRSDAAISFIVKTGAEVNLETDLCNSSQTIANNSYYGYTALSLRKKSNLDITIEKDALLNVKAAGTKAGYRSAAPVVIWGAGSSTTTTSGELNVRSENGNGWYYKYGNSAGDANFIVESTGVVDILANNQGKLGRNEYAAFEAYGAYNTSVIVRDGGQMKVLGNGYRGMSLAASGSYAKKSILVTGENSNLYIGGNEWAIAAETQPKLSVTAEKGGNITLESLGTVGNGLNKTGGAPSTVYSVGPTTYTVDGSGSAIDIKHHGGTYSAIFHDGYGALTVNVINGGVMNVDNVNSGTDTSARRAAICAQSTGIGVNGSTDNVINIIGAGSRLSVVNKNPYTHGNGGDTGLYPTGAVSFNTTAQGNINVKDGGDFIAVSSSLAPTIQIHNGKINLDNPGEMDIRNDSTFASTGANGTYSTSGLAVYNTRYASAAANQFTAALDVKDSDVTVWSTFETPFEDSKIDNHWADVTFTAKNKTNTTMPTLGSGGDTKLNLSIFQLSSYGRIYVRGHTRSPVLTGSKTVVDTSRTDGNTIVGNVLKYTIAVKNEEVYSRWKNVVFRDELPAGVDFDDNSEVYVDGKEITDYTYKDGVLSVKLSNILGGSSVEISFTVTVNEDAYMTTITNTAEMEGDNGSIEVSDDGINVVSDTPDPTGNKVSKNLSRDSLRGQVGDILEYTITASNNKPNSTWSNVYVWDTIPVEVDFEDGTKVYLNGEEVTYTYDEDTRVLTVILGDIAGGKLDGSGKDTKTLVFNVVINELGYNKYIYNSAKIDSVATRSLSTIQRTSDTALTVTDQGQEVGCQTEDQTED